MAPATLIQLNDFRFCSHTLTRSPILSLALFTSFYLWTRTHALHRNAHSLTKQDYWEIWEGHGEMMEDSKDQIEMLFSFTNAGGHGEQNQTLSAVFNRTLSEDGNKTG